MKKYLYLLIISVLFITLTAGCGANETSKSKEELKEEIKAEMEAEKK